MSLLHAKKKKKKLKWAADVCGKYFNKNEFQDSGDGQDDPLPLPPPPLLLVEFARGLGEEHYILFALDLPLEELQGGAVEAHHVLKHREGEDGIEHNAFIHPKLGKFA